MENKPENQPNPTPQASLGHAIPVASAPVRPSPAPTGVVASPKTQPQASTSHPTVSEKTANHPASKPVPESPKQQKPTVVIVIAILVALSLAGTAAFVFLRDRASDHPEEHTENSGNESTTADVDDADKDVDETLNSVKDAEDLPESDLTDQTLGL